MYSFTHIKIVIWTNMAIYFSYIKVAYILFAYESFSYVELTFISHV